MKIHQKYTAELYSFLVNDATLPSNNLLRFRQNILEWIFNEIMTTDDQIKGEKLQYDINREAAKISVLSSGKVDKYKCLTDEKILPFNQKTNKRTS